MCILQLFDTMVSRFKVNIKFKIMVFTSSSTFIDFFCLLLLLIIERDMLNYANVIAEFHLCIIFAIFLYV